MEVKDLRPGDRIRYDSLKSYYEIVANDLINEVVYTKLILEGKESPYNFPHVLFDTPFNYIGNFAKSNNFKLIYDILNEGEN